MTDQPEPQDKPFYARAVRAEYNDAHKLILSANNYSDKRRVTVYDSEPFFKVLLNSDPFILKDFRQVGRQLIPVWRLNLERGRIVSWAMLPTTPEEEAQRYRRDIFDRIYEDTRNLFLPYGDVEETIRAVQQVCTLDQLRDLAVEALQDFKRRDDCRKAMNLVRFDKRERDYWPEENKPELTEVDRRRKAAMHAYPRKG